MTLNKDVIRIRYPLYTPTQIFAVVGQSSCPPREKLIVKPCTLHRYLGSIVGMCQDNHGDVCVYYNTIIHQHYYNVNIIIQVY